MGISASYDINAAQERSKNLYLAIQKAKAYTEDSDASVFSDTSLASTIFGEVGSGNTCTDGKDDGHIGFLSAVGNIFQGAVRTIPNMIKGAFTDGDGKFSLKKTLMTVGAGAFSIACPAAGILACGVGVISGVYNTGKNVVAALNATTDEEAKSAWERVGQGATTTVISVRGMKASYGAMQKSAGGANSNMANLKGNGFFGKIKENGPFNTVRAFLKDSVTSTKNNLATAWNKMKSLPSNIKSARTDVKNAKTDLKNCKDNLSKAETELRRLQKNGSQADIANKSSEIAKYKVNVKDATTALADAKSNTGFGKLTSVVSNTVNKYTQNTRTAAGLTNATKFKTINTAMNVFRLATHPIKTAAGLRNDASAVIEALNSNTLSNEAIISKFGYETVSQVLYALGGNAALGAIEESDI